MLFRNRHPLSPSSSEYLLIRLQVLVPKGPVIEQHANRDATLALLAQAQSTPERTSASCGLISRRYRPSGATCTPRLSPRPRLPAVSLDRAVGRSERSPLLSAHCSIALGSNIDVHWRPIRCEEYQRNRLFKAPASHSAPSLAETHIRRQRFNAIRAVVGTVCERDNNLVAHRRVRSGVAEEK